MRRSGAMPLVLTLVIALGWLTYTLTFGARTPQLGLDLQGGTSVVLGVKTGQTATSAQLDQAISIIRRRVDGLGVAEPEITRQGKFIVVSLPGVKDAQHAIDLVGRTAKLQFRPYCTALPTHLSDGTYTKSLDPAYGGLCVKPAEGAADEQPVVALDDQNKAGTPDACDVLGPVALSGEAVSSAQASIPQGAWVVELELKGSGLDGFNALSQRCFNKDTSCPGGRTAIVLDGEVQSNPAPQTATFQSTQIEI